MSELEILKEHLIHILEMDLPTFSAGMLNEAEDDGRKNTLVCVDESVRSAVFHMLQARVQIDHYLEQTFTS